MRPSSTPLPSLDALKDQAKRLRARFSAEGQDISHSRALELIAAQYGFRDWNTLHARLGNMPPKRTLSLGDKASGRYLGKSFTGKIIAVQRMMAGNMTRVTFDFDEPVNVSQFESFAVMRKRVVCTLDEDGRTVEKTSNGVPHVELT